MFFVCWVQSFNDSVVHCTICSLCVAKLKGANANNDSNEPSLQLASCVIVKSCLVAQHITICNLQGIC
jgi:hypothetical protein